MKTLYNSSDLPEDMASYVRCTTFLNVFPVVFFFVCLFVCLCVCFVCFFISALLCQSARRLSVKFFSTETVRRLNSKILRNVANNHIFRQYLTNFFHFPIGSQHGILPYGREKNQNTTPPTAMILFQQNFLQISPMTVPEVTYWHFEIRD